MVKYCPALRVPGCLTIRVRFDESSPTRNHVFNAQPPQNSNSQSPINIYIYLYTFIYIYISSVRLNHTELLLKGWTDYEYDDFFCFPLKKDIGLMLIDSKTTGPFAIEVLSMNP